MKCRWCCEELKEKPSKKIKLKHRILGIRAEESFNRRQRKRIHKYRGWYHYYPIFGWTEADVWAYILEERLPYFNIYDLGEHRTGCVICPYNPARLRATEKYPILISKLKKAFKEFYENHYWIKKRGTFNEIWDYYIQFGILPKRQNEEENLFTMLNDTTDK